MKKWLCVALCAGMMFGAVGCGGNRTGTVENKEMTLSLPYGERDGIYSGDIVEGIPDGYGKFETKNDEGTSWVYEGYFSAGIFEGEGRTEWENGQVQTGMYHEGIWVASELGLLEFMESCNEISVSEEARSFIKENAELFPADSIEKVQNLVDENITYKMVTKEPAKYGNQIMKISDVYVVQINTENIYPEYDDKYTYVTLLDNDLNVYQCYTIGEVPNIYKGDVIETIYGVPVGNNSYESTSGGFVNSVVIAPCWIDE